MSDKAVHMMVVAPHPGDAEWGIGGTVARLTGEGKEVIYVVCTNGDKAAKDPMTKPEELAKIREREQLAAAKLVGVREVNFLRHPDLGLEDAPGFRKEIIRLILKYRPEIIATCDPKQEGYISHPDHRATGRTTLDAIWPFALAPNSYLDLVEEGFYIHRVREVLLWQAEEPNCSYDISDTFEIKLAALCCLKSQLGDPVSSEDVEYIRERAKMAAKGKKYELGEAFYRLAVPKRL
jgi:LmbE family N-acetylglucosaminyl deacetylase